MSTENPDRIEVPQIPGPDTNGSEWVHTGISREMPLPVQLSAEQVIERQRDGRNARKIIHRRMAKALAAHAETALELKHAKTAKTDVDAKCAILDQEVETERTMRDGTVEILHRYPVAGGMPTEILIRRDDGYEGMRHGSERELPAEEWVAQSSVPGTVSPPAADDLSVVRSAILDLVTVDEWLPTPEIVRAVVDRLGDDCTPDIVNLYLLSLAADGVIRVLVAEDESTSYKLVGETTEPETADSAPESADDKELDATEEFDAAVLQRLRELAPKWVAEGPDASAGKVCKHAVGTPEFGPRWTGPNVNDALKRLADAGLAHKIPKTRSYQAISIVE